MSSKEELEFSIQQYETQLNHVDETLKTCTNDVEKTSLENLKCDLRELLDLTRETLNEQTKSVATEDPDDDLSNDDENGHDAYAKEMALFMSEIKSCETSDSVKEGTSKCYANGDETRKELEKFKDDMRGKKCSAPYTFAWGARNYHNALVCGLETDIEQVTNINDICVTVLFTNPIHRNMVPCPFYLDGDCRFDNDKCRFSHGESVRYSELRDYKKPNFSLLNHLKHPVLAKQSDNIWYKGRVVSNNFSDKTCQIILEHNKKEVKCDFHDILPIEEDTPFIASSDSELSDDDDYEQMHRASLIEKSLLTLAPNQALGEWEKHTKGFGSRMLQKFGYVIGTGLGQNGEGIIVPISAQILPQGRSLDHCMELREQANGDKDLFSVERKLKRLKKKEEQISAKAYEKEKKKVDVFSFINDNIFSTNSPATSASSLINNEPKQTKADFKNQTNKNLNVESLKIGEEIRRMEKEILKLQESLRRQKDGTPISQQLNMQLNVRNSELNRLRKSETILKKEQVFRKDKSKLTIF